MAEFTEWSELLERELALPFAKELHAQKDRKGTFVAYQHYVSRLNKLVGVNGWSMEGPITYHAGNKFGIAVGVTILGVTRWNVGDEMEDHGEPVEYTDERTGEVKEKVVDFGSSSTNSFAQAFKRTCSLFGLGLYLYDKDWTKRYLTNGGPISKPAPRPVEAQARAIAEHRQTNVTDMLELLPDCPSCGGAMNDLRETAIGKQPVFRCKDRECKDSKGYTTAIFREKWEEMQQTMAGV